MDILAKKSAYEKYAGKDPSETLRNRDVYEKQQMDRAQAEELESPTWRVVVAVLGGLLVALGVYVVLSLATGAMGSFGSTFGVGAGSSSVGAGGGGTGFGAIDNDNGALFGALGDDGSGNFGALADDGSGTGTSTSCSGTTSDDSNVMGIIGSDGSTVVETSEGRYRVVPGDTPFTSMVDWMVQNTITEVGGVWYDAEMNVLSVDEIASGYLAYLEAAGGTKTKIEVGGTDGAAAEGSSNGSEASVTGSNGSEGSNSGRTSNGASGGSEGSGTIRYEGMREPTVDDELSGSFDMPEGSGDALVGPTKEQNNSIWSWFAPSLWKVVISFFAGLIAFALFYQVLMRNLATQNQIRDGSDINPYENDQHIAFPDEIQRAFDWFPDIGAHSGVQVSSLISHMMLSNKGLKNIELAERAKENVLDENGDIDVYKGEILYDDDGNAITKSVPMIDEKLGKALFDSAKIPEKLREFYDPKKIPYNPGNENRDKLKGYDTVADLINKEWEFPEYEPQRPAGAYIVDTAPVNTI